MRWAIRKLAATGCLAPLPLALVAALVAPAAQAQIEIVLSWDDDQAEIGDLNLVKSFVY